MSLMNKGQSQAQRTLRQPSSIAHATKVSIDLNVTKTSSNQVSNNNSSTNVIFSDENLSNHQNHQCMWRKSFEDEHQKRIESENLYISCLKKLEIERDKRIQMEKGLEEMRQRMIYLEQRNTYLEGEIKQRNSASKRITFCAGISEIRDNGSNSVIYQSPDIINKLERSMSPHASQQFLFKMNSLEQRNSIEMGIPPVQQKIRKQSLHNLINSESSIDAEEEISNQKIKVNLINKKSINTKVFPVEIDSLPTQPQSIRSQLKQVSRDSVDSQPQLQQRRVQFENAQSSNFAPMTQQYQSLSIDYRDNDPQLYQVDNQQTGHQLDRQQKNHALWKFKSSDNFNFSADMHSDMARQSYDVQQQYSTRETQNPKPQFTFEDKELIENVLSLNKKQKLGFSKLRIIQINETGKVDKIKLKVDNIRIAQREFFSKMRKQRRAERGQMQVAKSMNFSDIPKGPGGMHQIQPSQMLKKDSLFDEKYHNLQIQSSMDFENINHNRMLDNEEDAIDCQEGNKTPFYQYNEGLSTKRPQVMFQNHEVMMFQSPRQANKALVIQDYRYIVEDDQLAQTRRIMENEYEDEFQDYNLLETPVHRLSTKNEIKEYDTHRAAEYSDTQKREMEKSIINRSTNKKIGRRQKFTAGSISNKLEKKNLESFREQSNIIKEETYGLNLSDDEQQSLNAPNESQDKSAIVGDTKMIKNPNYGRITHASKQMEFLGHFRNGGQTMGFRNEFSLANNPLLKSMPNLDFLKQIDKNSSSLPFDEVSGSLGQSGLHHQSTLLDINNSSFMQPIKTNKFNAFGTPMQSNKSAKNLLSGNYDSPGKSSGKGKSNLFEEFFIIGIDQQDLQQLDWSKTKSQFAAPKTLHMHINGQETNCERRRVVKDFCFPDGVEATLIKEKGEPMKKQASSKFEKVLYQTKSGRESCFIFTMNADEEPQSEKSFSVDRSNYLETFPGGGTQEKFYNCLCVVFNELQTDNINKQIQFPLSERDLDRQFENSRIYSTKKAYCFMFCNQFYNLHLEAINLLRNVQKDDMIRKSKEIVIEDFREGRNGIEKAMKLQIIRDVYAMLQLPLLNENMLMILDQYFEYEYSQLRVIDMHFNLEIGSLRYDIPIMKELSYMDNKWFCPQLFSLFRLEVFLQLLAAVMLEKSVIFVGKQNLLSSAVLGLSSLLYPFKWCFAFVPILPHPLIDMIEAPLPILVGITKREYKDLNLTLTQDEKDSKIWVFLESGQVKWSIDSIKIPHFKFDNLEGKIDSDYQSFKSSTFTRTTTFQTSESRESTEGNQWMLESSRSSMVSEMGQNDISLLYNDQLRDKCQNICETIRKTIKNQVLGPLKDIKKSRNYKTDNLVQDMGARVKNKAKKQDKEFIQSFVETQMFATYIEEIFM